MSIRYDLRTDHRDLLGLNMDKNLAELGREPEFLALQRKRSCFSWTMFAIMFSVFFSYISTIAFFPELLAAPIRDDSSISLGIPYAVLVILAGILLTSIFIIVTNRYFEPRMRALVDKISSNQSE